MPDCLEMPYQPVITGASQSIKDHPYPYRIGGVSCLAGDFIPAYSFAEPVSIGDTLIFEDMIHYTMVKTTMFNGIQHPSIGLWHEEGKFELVRSFTYDDYRSRLS
jgi:carboxynorspermidine decarboxylase